MHSEKRNHQRDELRKSWLARRIFWLVQNGHTWEIEIETASPDPVSDFAWTLIARISDGHRFPEPGEGTLYPQELYTEIIDCFKNSRGGYYIKLESLILSQNWNDFIPDAA